MSSSKGTRGWALKRALQKGHATETGKLREQGDARPELKRIPMRTPRKYASRSKYDANGNLLRDALGVSDA